MTFVFDSAQIDSNITGARNTVAVATTATGALASAFAAGETVDGYALALGDRILIKDQTTDTQNGIYIVEATGPPTRASDAEVGRSLGGQYVWVRNGTVNGNTGFICTNADGSDVVNTDGLVFTQFDVVGTLALDRGGTGADLTGVTAERILQVNSGSNALETTDTPVVTSLLAATGNTFLDFTDSTTPVNNLVIENADTGVSPAITTAGTDSNIGMDLKDSNGNDLLTLVSVAGGVDSATLRNGSGAVVFGADGASANIDFNINTKGAGVINLLDLAHVVVGSGNGIDTDSAGAMFLGETNATDIRLGARALVPAGTGNGVDTAGAGALYLGEANATSIEIGDTGVTTTVRGDLAVNGTTTTVDSETVLVADNHLYLNNGYTTTTAQTGGLVVNYLPLAGGTTSTTGGFATTSTVNVTLAAGLSPGDIIQVSGAANPANDGIYVVDTHLTNVITIKTTLIDDFFQTAFTVDNTDTTAVITRVTLSVMRAGTDGTWEVGSGSTDPITFNDLALAQVTRSFSVLSLEALATSTSFSPVGYFAWDDTLYGTATTRTVIYYYDTTTGAANRTLQIEVDDGTTQTPNTESANTSGIGTFTIPDPGADALLTFSIKKNTGGGSTPSVYAIHLELAP
jgi:hypothetical protein